MWLHHIVVHNIHPRPGDTVCPWYIPERFFASGNERTPVDFTSHGKQEIGYYIPEHATLLVAPELMNETPCPRPVIVTITYEYVLLKHARGREFKKVTPVWLAISGTCGPSDVDVPIDPNTNILLSAFNLTMIPPWPTNITGTIAFSAGHVHDGGTSLSITRNGTPICSSSASYGASPGYVEANSSMGMNSTIDMRSCFVSPPLPSFPIYLFLVRRARRRTRTSKT